MRAPETLVQLLERAATFPDAGLRFLDRREREEWASWAEIHEAARAVGAALADLGLNPGERVAVVYPTGREFFHAFFGVLLAGAVPVPLYPPVRFGRRDEYHRRTSAMLRASGARLVLAEHRVARTLGPTVDAARPPEGCRTLAELPDAGPSAAWRSVDVGPEALALVQFSSGTTHDPKPVALSHRAVVAQTRILNGFWPDTGDVRHSGVSWLPLYHDMGLIGAVFPALERPGVLTLLAPETFVARPATWLRALSSYGGTISAAPSFAYGLAVEKIRDSELEGVDLSAWQLALTGAETIAPAVLRRFRERFAPWGFRPTALTPVYGLAEASLAVTFSKVEEPMVTRRFDRDGLSIGRASEDPDGIEIPSLGPPVPGFEIRIVDENRQPVADGRVGRLFVRGPSLMEGYLGQLSATEQAFHDGWLDTGDLGFLRNRELYLTGRAKDVVILRGRNHAPEEIERAVDDVDGVRQGGAVAVSYLPEGGESEELLLFVERARNGGNGIGPVIAGACAEVVLAATGLGVDHVIVLEPGSLPRTSSGKKRRAETLRRHLASELKTEDGPACEATC